MSTTMAPRTSSEIRLDQAYQRRDRLKPDQHAECADANQAISKLREEVTNDPVRNLRISRAILASIPADQTARRAEMLKLIGDEEAAIAKGSTRAARPAHSAAPATPAPPARPSPGSRPIGAAEARRRKSWDEAARLMLAAQTKAPTPAAPALAQASARQPIGVWENRPAGLTVYAASISDGRGGLITKSYAAGEAPKRSIVPQGMVGAYAFQQRLEFDSAGFERFLAAGWLPKPASTDSNGNRLWRESDVAAAVEKFRK